MPKEIEWKNQIRYKNPNPGAIGIQANVEGVRIYITNDHIYYRGQFIFHCHQLGLTEEKLDASDVESAKKKALEIVSKKLKEKIHELQSAQSAIEIGVHYG